MNIIEFSTPAPSCLIPATHPARAYVPAHKTDVRKTIAPYWPDYSMCDDYDLTDRLGYLEQPGRFK